MIEAILLGALALAVAWLGGLQMERPVLLSADAPVAQWRLPLVERAMTSARAAHEAMASELLHGQLVALVMLLAAAAAAILFGPSSLLTAAAVAAYVVGQLHVAVLAGRLAAIGLEIGSLRAALVLAETGIRDRRLRGEVDAVEG